MGGTIQGVRGLPGVGPLTSPALLSPRERREKDTAKHELLLVPLSPSGREGPGE
jgi:hypothetical protein